MLLHIRTRDTRYTRLIGILVIIQAVLLLPSPASALQGTPAATSAIRVSAEDAIAQVISEDGVIRFDVAENGTLYTWSGSPELADGIPTVATAYVTQGYIYPEGTLTGSNGVLQDGSPESPDKVIGHWSCFGWWLGDDVHVSSAPWLNSHLFNCGPVWGEAMLASEGYSSDDLEVPLNRALTGGTGPYEGVTGVQVETNLGLNPSGGMNFRHEIRITKS
jgi:hypothetical protein